MYTLCVILPAYEFGSQAAVAGAWLVTGCTSVHPDIYIGTWSPVALCCELYAESTIPWERRETKSNVVDILSTGSLLVVLGCIYKSSFSMLNDDNVMDQKLPVGNGDLHAAVTAAVSLFHVGLKTFV
jgi:hypothetical protein